MRVFVMPVSNSAYDTELVAVNHWPVAIATHEASHKFAHHLCENLDNVDPRKVFPSEKIDYLSHPLSVHISALRQVVGSSQIRAVPLVGMYCGGQRHYAPKQSLSRMSRSGHHGHPLMRWICRSNLRKVLPSVVGYLPLRVLATLSNGVCCAVLTMVMSLVGNACLSWLGVMARLSGLPLRTPRRVICSLRSGGPAREIIDWDNQGQVYLQ